MSEKMGITMGRAIDEKTDIGIYKIWPILRNFDIHMKQKTARKVLNYNDLNLLTWKTE